MYNVVSYSIVITPTGTSTAGETFFLDCSLSGTIDPVTYQWINSTGTQLTNVSQLQFSPLLPSHAGLYICQTTVGGVELVETTYNLTVNRKCMLLATLLQKAT